MTRAEDLINEIEAKLRRCIGGWLEPELRKLSELRAIVKGSADCESPDPRRAAALGHEIENIIKHHGD